ncbi:MAG: 3-oxoacyl-ACP reductase [Planctomyces sp.]|uniref:3-oxoacyl-(Acyl-carrier-protein) reductase n=1 Tax=Rubinisphaera brasiliensis (strain ATCC 49424 / DSM 5305 / JCM 21570 / IAM 15109 / NBRC 103401 / IFAM 1448) TaxID=756272 RepID=F0SHL7_RUBBR|nr:MULTISPECIES: glucose 1-dehydrogenase [Rubinisphaera]ADY58455.1 3-oxoacyl-(acyl-carrier-protein) reductase [Rubinisphaera brasiliensis DSM 5305]MBB02446.1 3-oxoacyl-ACP reductase [Planctomyces sp.]
MQVNGKNILITGASRGIGRGCAVEVAKAGANVAINYHSNADAANEVVAEIEALGRKAIAIQADVSKQESVEAMVQETAEKLGSVDCYVSNAVYSDRERMVEADMDGFRRTIDVSMWGAFYGVRAAAQQMLKQGKGGAITVVSSPHAFIPFPGAMAYNMAKAAIDQMAKTAATELAGDKIRVNVVHPGWIDTPGERKFFSEEQLAQGAGNIPLDRLGTPSEIGRAILYTLSDDATYMTGSTLLIDGGITLPWWSNLKDGK